MPTFSKYAFAAASAVAVVKQASGQNWQVLQASRSTGDVAESLFSIDVSELRERFGDIGASAARGGSDMLKLPMPNGELGEFHLENAKHSTMSPGLAARFPNIKTYEGVGVDANDDVTLVSAVFSESGFFAQYSKPDGGIAYLDTIGGFPAAGRVDLRSYDHVLGSKHDSNSGECLLNETPKKLPSEKETKEVFDAIPRRRLQDECNPGYASFVGNFRCEALLNTPECNYDGGDCCGGYSSKFACLEEEGMSCECIDPKADMDILTKYRIAIATTVEYSTFHGNTTENILSALVTTMARVNGVYKRELAVYMEITENTTQLFDLPGEEVRFINEADVINTSTELFALIVGSDSYDIGHVVSTGSGGVASLGSVCAPERKAAGTTGLPGPVGDPFDIDYVAHEIGHQFHGDHTFAGCSSNAGSDEYRYEPGSGTTIMAYAGICREDNIASNSDPMFHSASIAEIKRFTNNPLTGGSCGEVIQVDIPRPVLNPDLSFPVNETAPLRECVIPQETPFRLEAINAPIDETSFHYIWEQSIDSLEISNINGPQQTDTALFRTFNPKRFNAARTFPSLATVVSGKRDLAERLPTIDRSIGFTLAVRSYFNAGGDLTEDLTEDVGVGTTYMGDFVYVDVDSSLGEPLRVAQPSGTVSFGEPFDISWTGGITNDTVRVLLSLDGGATFPFVVAQDIDIAAGSATVEIPTGKGFSCNADGFTQARFMVQSINEATPGCSYLNVNPADIVVDSCGTFPTAAPTPPTQSPTFLTQAPTAGPPPPKEFELSGAGYFSDEGVFADEDEALAYDPLPPYLPNTDNIFTITVPQGERVVVEFIYFNTEADYDFVYVMEGNNNDTAAAVSQLAGPIVPNNATAPLRIESEGNILTLRFISDVAVEEPGFVARFSSISGRRLDNLKSVSVDVVGSLTGSDSIELDAFFEDMVPSGFFGKWVYTSTSGVLRLSFDKFDIGYGTGIVRVYDGSNADAKLLRVVTGSEVPTPVQSSSNKLFVTFTAAKETSGRGFAASITAIGASSWYWIVGIGVGVVSCAGLIVGGKWHFDRKARQAREKEAAIAAASGDRGASLELPESDEAKLISGNPLYGKV